GVGRDGLTAHTIAQAAQHYGLRVRAFSLAPADFRHVPLPAIVHWNFNHFVVVERWSPTQVGIVDPTSGRRRLTAAEFDAGFTGVVLTLEPSVQFDRHGTIAYPSWRHYMKSLLRAPGTLGVLAQILVASLLLQVLGLALPTFTQVLVDHVLPLHLTNV